MSDFRKHLEEMMNDPAFAAEWERMQPEMEVMRAVIEARSAQNMTQAELARKSGIRQSNISRIENGTSSPTVATLQQIADGLGKRLHIEFI